MSSPERTFRLREFTDGETIGAGQNASPAFGRAIAEAHTWLGSVDGNGAAEIDIGPGQFMLTDCIRRVDMAGVHLEGDGEGATTLIAAPILAGRHLLDLTGSYDCGTYKMSIGDPSQGTWVVPATAIYAAQIPLSVHGTRVPSNALHFEHLAVFGSYSHACLYAYSVASSGITKCRFHNDVDGAWASALTLTDTNRAGLVPDGTDGSGLIGPRSRQASGWQVRDSEFHDLSRLNASGYSLAVPVRLDGVRSVHLDGGNIQGTGLEYVELRTWCQLVTLRKLELYCEARAGGGTGPDPLHVFHTVDGSMSDGITLDDAYVHLADGGEVFGVSNGSSYNRTRTGLLVHRDGWVPPIE